MPGGGGPRKNAGRKSGAATIRSRRIADELGAEGTTPLHIMIDTMREIWSVALGIPEQADRIRKKIEACAIAEKVAPYIHPKLASTDISVRRVNDIRDLSDKELEALLASAARIASSEDGSRESDQVH